MNYYTSSESFISSGYGQVHSGLHSQRTQLGRVSLSPVRGSWFLETKFLMFTILAIDTALSPPQLIADIAKRSPLAHLFYLYDILVEIASMPRKAPSYTPDLGVRELDARVMARQCLKDLGRELGVS
jgi:hypothetical protein